MVKEVFGMIDKVRKIGIDQRIIDKKNRFSKLELSSVSASMAYYMTMAISPFIIVLVSVLLNLSLVIEWPKFLLQEFTTVIPIPVLKVLKPIVEEISQKGHLSTISLSTLSILWASTKGWDTFIHIMDKIYHQEPRNFILKKLLGVLLVFSLIISIILFLMSISFGKIILEKFYEWNIIPFLYHRIINLGRIIGSFLLILFLLSCLYHWMSRRRSKLRYAFQAAIIPAFLWISISVGLSWYVDNFTRFSFIYGSLMGIILLSFWLYLIMQFILLGAFLHSEILIKENVI